MLALVALSVAVLWPAPAAGAQASEVLTGRILDQQRDPVAGVSITVTDSASAEIGTSITAEDGRWTVDLPGAGTYTVTIDVATIPDGLELSDPDAAAIEVEVATGQAKAVQFPLVEVGGTTEGGEEAATEEFRGNISTRDDPSTPDADEAGPVADVEISVVDAEGDEVGSAVTDEEGNYRIPLPGPGTYTATLNQDTLPEGVTLTNPDRASLTLDISPRESSPLLFPLGEGSSAQGTLAGRVLQNAVLGLSFGLVIAMTAIGLSLIFGTTGFTNFAHGELVTFGALVAYFFNEHAGLPLPVAAPIAMLFGALCGGAQEAFIWGPLRRRRAGLVAMLVTSIGFALLVRFIFLNVFQGRSRPYNFQWGSRARDFGPIAISPKDLLSIGVSIVVLVGVGLMLQRSRAGKAMRAVADNPDLASSSGINVNRVVLTVWVLAGALACLGGVLFGATQEGVKFDMGFTLLLLMFAGVTLGGLGTAYGALVGSVVIGMLVQLSTIVLAPELKNAAALSVMILVLLVRPQGILGRAERVG